MMDRESAIHTSNIREVFDDLMHATCECAATLYPHCRRLIDGVVREPLWSSDTPFSRRIPWRLANEARIEFSTEFNSHGLYLLGADKRLLYVGKTDKSLWKRLRSRYIGRPEARRQLPLAAKIADGSISAEKLSDLSKVRSLKVRVRHATAVAPVIEKVWFAVFPVQDATPRGCLEILLIHAGNEWNAVHDFPPMLNTEHTKQD